MNEVSLPPADLQALHSEFVEAFRSNDTGALELFFSSAAVLLPPRRASVQGRQAIAEFWQAAQRLQDLQFSPANVHMLADSVMREAGTLRMTMRGQGRETRVMAMKYVTVWTKAGARWAIDTMAWNAAAGGGGGQGGNRPGAAARGQRRGGGQGGGGQGGGGQGGGGRNRFGGGQGQGGGGQGGGRFGGGQGNVRQAAGPAGSGFGRNAALQRDNQQAPLVPLLD